MSVGKVSSLFLRSSEFSFPNQEVRKQIILIDSGCIFGALPCAMDAAFFMQTADKRNVPGITPGTSAIVLSKTNHSALYCRHLGGIVCHAINLLSTSHKVKSVCPCS